MQGADWLIKDFLSVKNVLFFGIGGGGDVVTAAMLALAARREGYRAYIGSVVWERMSVDPVPGPIPIDELVGVHRIGRYSAMVKGSSRALRGGREVAFQASNVAQALNEEVAVVDLSAAAEGVAEGLAELIRELDVEAVVAVDVGGDVLAKGYEDELWSPLADAVGLAALVRARVQVQKVLAVHSIGADGELSPGYILERISTVSSLGGLLGARGITARDVEILERLLEHAHSEASRVQLEAFKGCWGQHVIRAGSREIECSPLQTITFFLDPYITLAVAPLAQAVLFTKSIKEARSILNSMGVYTELDLEEDAYTFMRKHGRLPRGDELRKLREEGRARLLFKALSRYSGHGEYGE
ncbi:MAG: hypothetical protein DRO12_00155 [Thermoprotei archaeon]|nr:MAG: hypothetical protein DRO12_00155 [Thermoprotei archaeon]